VDLNLAFEIMILELSENFGSPSARVARDIVKHCGKDPRVAAFIAKLVEETKSGLKKGSLFHQLHLGGSGGGQFILQELGLKEQYKLIKYKEEPGNVQGGSKGGSGKGKEGSKGGSGKCKEGSKGGSAQFQ